jgi:hypothetical protein
MALPFIRAASDMNPQLEMIPLCATSSKKSRQP